MRSCSVWKRLEASVVRMVQECMGSESSPSFQQSYSPTCRAISQAVLTGMSTGIQHDAQGSSVLCSTYNCMHSKGTVTALCSTRPKYSISSKPLHTIVHRRPRPHKDAQPWGAHIDTSLLTEAVQLNPAFRQMGSMGCVLRVRPLEKELVPGYCMPSDNVSQSSRMYKWCSILMQLRRTCKQQWLALEVDVVGLLDFVLLAPLKEAIYHHYAPAHCACGPRDCNNWILYSVEHATDAQPGIKFAPATLRDSEFYNQKGKKRQNYLQKKLMV